MTISNGSPQMNAPEKPPKGRKRFPLAPRIAAAVIMLGFAAWELYRAGHVTPLELLIVAILAGAALSRPWSRFFWYLLGAASGIFLGLIFPHLRF